jgi:two-component system CheB/CheR fusion protein
MSHGFESSVTASDGSPPNLVVGIGAFAGPCGLQELLAHTPADTGMAFVLVQHLPPTTKAFWSSAGAQSPIPVVAARDGLAVKGRTVSSSSAGATLTIRTFSA